MTENKQITIYDLLPLLTWGYVAMSMGKHWFWYPAKPSLFEIAWGADRSSICLSSLFNIAPFDGDWKDSLMEIKE